MASKSKARPKKGKESLTSAHPAGHESPEVRPEDPVDELIHKLSDPDPVVRSTAAGSLGHTKSQKAVEPLIKSLRDPHPYVRHGAAWALGEIRSEDAISPLQDALHDEDEITRGKAAEALGKILGT